MRTLRRSECAVLHLVLKRRWYDMIESGEKREEYRDARQYWVRRIHNWHDRPITRPGVKVIAFSRGYREADMFFTAHVWPRCTIVVKREYPHPEWGEPETPHYVLALDERVELEEEAPDGRA